MIVDLGILIRFLLGLTRISREGKMFFGSSKKTPHTWGMSESQRRLQLFTPYSSEPPNRDLIDFELLITIWELWKHAETRWKNSETSSVTLGSSQRWNTNSWRADWRLSVSTFLFTAFLCWVKYTLLIEQAWVPGETSEWITHVFATTAAWRYKLTALHEIC